VGNRSREGLTTVKYNGDFPQDYYGNCEGLEIILKMANEALIRAGGGH